MIAISLFYYCEKAFILMNIWIGKNSWKIRLPGKEDFYSHLNIEDNTDADYEHAKRVHQDFETKHLGEYHDLYVQSDTLLLAVVSS